jgi:tetratricopeptide (TPR) repeat protein
VWGREEALAGGHTKEQRLEAAEAGWRKVFGLRRRLFHSDHPELAVGLNNLAYVLQERGDFNGGEALYREALEMMRRLFPADHPDVAWALNNLGSVLRSRGEHGATEPLYREALEMMRRLFPADHPDVAWGLSNLAFELYSRRDLAAAERLFGEALQIKRRLFPADHPEVARDLDGLAYVFEGRGNLAAAESLFREALEMTRRLFSAEHAEVARGLNNLAVLLRERGDLAAAEPLQRDALEMWRRLFPTNHAHVATGLDNLGVVLIQRGDLGAGEPLVREALDLRRRLFPADHSDVATSINNLAQVYRLRGDLAASEPLFREGLEMTRRLFSADNPIVAGGLNNLAVVLQARGDLAAAEPLYREALDIWRRLFLSDHREVALGLNNLAYVLEARGNLAAAESLFREAIEMWRRLFPMDHPDVALGLNNLAHVLDVRGDLGAAEPLYREAMEMRRRLFSGDHMDLATGLSNLAGVFEARGNLGAAEPLLREALDMWRRLLPADHPNVASGLANLAYLLEARGDLAAAEPLLLEALGVSEGLRSRIVGDERSRGQIAGMLRLPQIAAQYAALLTRLDQRSEVFTVCERFRARSFLDLLERSALDLEAAARERTAADPKARERLDAAIARERQAQVDVTTAEKLHEGLQRDRRAADVLDGLSDEERERRRKELDPRIEAQLAEVKNARQALSEAGASVLVELRGLFPEGKPLSREEVLARLPEGDLVLSFLWAGGRVVLATAGSNATSGALLAGDEKREKELRQLASLVRGAVAPRQAPIPGAPPPDPAPARELLAALLPPEARALARSARRLVVLADGPLQDIPFEVLLASAEEPDLHRKPVVYAASATVSLRGVAAARKAAAAPDRALTALLLGDPLYDRDPLPEPKVPEKGALLSMVAPDSNAARADLRRGDVVLAYDGREIADAAGLGAAIDAIAKSVAAGERSADAGIAVAYWREGHAGEARVQPGRLGVQLDPRGPMVGLREMARAARGLENLAAEVSATDQVRLFGGSLKPLPGTRREALAIDALLAKAGGRGALLLGEEASIANLTVHAPGKRFVLLATHGLVGSTERPYDSSLALTRPKEVTAQDVGFLRLDDLIRSWRGKLEDTDLVVLSACDTQRGQRVGDSAMALPWGFFFAGAKTVVASLWQVDDEATSLLMVRFFENLLGVHEAPRRAGARAYGAGAAMAPEPALREAREWLRSLTAVEAGRARERLGKLVEDAESARKELASATRGPGGLVPRPTEKLPADVRPYAHPYYWAAFVCVGAGD